MSAALPEVSRSIREHPLPKLLFYLYRKQFTGRMVLQHETSENHIYLRDGMPVEAHTAEQVEPTGRILLDQGLIDDQLYNRSLAHMAETGQRQVEYLLEAGAVSQPNIDQALKQQLLRKMVRLFRLRNADFSLYREDHEYGRDAEEAARLRVHPRRVIYHGIRNSYDLEQIEAEVGNTFEESCFRIDEKKAANLERYHFGQEETDLIAHLRSQLWIFGQLQAAARIGELELKMVLYALGVTEMLELADKSSAQARPAPAPAASTFARQSVLTPISVPIPSGATPVITGPSGPPSTGVRRFTASIPTGAARTPAATASMRKPTRETETRPEPRAPADSAAFKKQIEDRVKALDKQDLFGVLGVTRTSTKDQIKTAYIGLAKQFHPDRLAQYQLQAMRPDVEKLFARLSEAQATLMNDGHRNAYIEKLDFVKGDAQKARKILEAENQFVLGENALRSKQFTTAEEHFKRAIDGNPEEGEHLALYAWAIYQNPKNSRPAVIDNVKQGLYKAIKTSPNNPRPYYLLGEVFLSESDPEKAIAQFNRALELRSDHVDAERGLRLARMRKENRKSGRTAPGEKKRGGLFDRFRKK